MRTIYKFIVNLEDHPSIQVPKGTELFHVAVQDGLITVWGVVPNDGAPLVTQRLRIAGTGHPVSDADHLQSYLGTVMTHGGALVWHVFKN